MRKPAFAYSKTKTQISFAVALFVIVQLICAFVFAYAKMRFSYDAAHDLVTSLHSTVG